MPGWTRRLLPQFGVYGLYLLMALVVTWPLVTVLSTRLLGHPFGDQYEYTRHIWWLNHALRTGQPLFFQPLLAYPDGLDGAHLWAAPLQSFPAWLFAFVMPLPAAFNLSILLRLALNGWAMYWLARHLTGQTLPSLIAGTIFLAYPAVQGQLGAAHTGLLVLWPVPLYAYALLRLRETAARRWIIWSALFFVLSALGNTQNAIYVTLPVTALFGLWELFARRWVSFGRLAASTIIGGLGLVAFALPLYLSTLQTPPYLRLTTGIVTYSAAPLAIFAPSFYHPSFRWVDLSLRLLGEDPFENAAYLGLIAGFLALVGVAVHRPARFWLLLALVAWVFSLGPLLRLEPTPVSAVFDGYQTHIPLPWLAFSNLPFINIIRTPVRFNFLVGLALAVMAAYGASVLWRSSHNRRLLRVMGVVILSFILFEYQFFWNVRTNTPEMFTVPGVVPEPIAALSARDDVRAVFDIPWDHPLAAKEGMWLQTGHHQPLIAGHVIRFTPVNPAKLAILQTTLDPDLLDQAQVDIVILHKNWADESGETEAFTREQLGDPIYEDEQYAVFDVPDAVSEAAFVALPASVEAFENEADSYVYLPDDGIVSLTVSLDAQGRDVQLLVDGLPFGPAIPTDLPLTTGYHVLTLSASPPCPPRTPVPLECRAVELRHLTLEQAP